MTRDLVATARALRPTILEHRRATEANRAIAEPIVERLVAERLCRMGLPTALGGLATPPVEALGVYEELAAAEASVPWIVWNNSLVCLFGRFMEKGAREQIFADPSWLYAQSTRPGGRAVVEGDGYRVSGRWSLVSGCELAEWLFLLCTIEDAGALQTTESGEPETRFLFVRRGDFEILDTWHVGGLRGTGSHDVAIENVFVPRERTVSPADPSTLDEPIGRIPIIPIVSAGFGAQILGVARTALDTVIEAARTKTTPGPTPDLRDRASAQASVALHATAVAAARSHLHACADRLWRDAVASHRSSLERIGDTYGAVLHASEVARAAVESMYAVGGTSSLYEACPLERAHRDIHAMLRHIVAQPMWAEDAGRVTFGLEPTSPLFAI